MSPISYIHNSGTHYSFNILGIDATGVIVCTSTEFGEGEGILFESDLDVARFFGVKVAVVRKALKALPK